ncbi:Taz1 interacting factor 1 [Schizosaccharomyces cryophilus OY26]|uniref:Autophagy-related protein 11 n=1 Tax=Schizosaccharomyces cryophilus (strain OY26 / ATCC MYA-4695 / CBS 11777 / NBRC 106824 / NRRL Y48691) TaxID=653667 RepID=S9VXW3_SCHCR|nr:Taz1 interacting factor 1 [Schizosaccharomyces cryophilus OY26]EPY52433.1 Taz1 interacting factor 1 [Schizosaccharomyces cryophilus OY26]
MRFKLNDSFSGKSWTIEDVHWTPQDLVSWIMKLDIDLSDDAKLLLPNGMSLNETLLDDDSNVVIYVLDQNLLKFSIPEGTPSLPSLEVGSFVNSLPNFEVEKDKFVSFPWKEKLLEYRQEIADFIHASYNLYEELTLHHNQMTTSLSAPTVAMNYLQRRQSGMKELLVVFYERLEKVSINDLLRDFLAMPVGSLPITTHKLLSPNWVKLDSWLNSISSQYSEAQKRVQQCIAATNSIVVSPFKEHSSMEEAYSLFQQITKFTETINCDLKDLLEHCFELAKDPTLLDSKIRVHVHHVQQLSVLVNDLHGYACSFLDSRKSSLITLKSFWLAFFKVSLKYDTLYEYLRHIAEELDRSKLIISQCQNIYSLFADILMEALRRTEWQASYNANHRSTLPIDQEKESNTRKSWLSQFSNFLFNHDQLRYLPTITRSELSAFLNNLQAEPKYQNFLHILSNRLSESLGFPNPLQGDALPSNNQEIAALQERLAIYQNRCNNLETIMLQQRHLPINTNLNDMAQPNTPRADVMDDGSQPFYRTSPSIVPLNIIRKFSQRKTSFSEGLASKYQVEVEQLRHELGEVVKRNSNLSIELNSKKERVHFLETENEELLAKYNDKPPRADDSSLRNEGSQNENPVVKLSHAFDEKQNIMSFCSVFESKVSKLQEICDVFKNEITTLRQQEELSEMAKDSQLVKKLLEEKALATQEQKKIEEVAESRREQCKVLTQKLFTLVFRCHELRTVLQECVGQAGQEVDRDGFCNGSDRQVQFSSKDLQYLYWMDNDDTDQSFQQFMNRMASLDIDSFHEFVVNVIIEAHNNELRWKREFQSNRDKALKAILESQTKVSLRNFKQGCLALFLPTRRYIQGQRIWAAFNVNAPNYYLKIQDISKLNSRDWMVGRITSIEDHVADGTIDKWLKLPMGTIWHYVDAIDERL